MPMAHEPPVRIVLPQQQAILGPRGEHAVRLLRAARDEVVNQHADVSLVAAQDERLFLPQSQRRIDARHDPLHGGFLIARGAVDLAGVEQVANGLGLQARQKLRRRREVVFDGITVADDVRALTPANRMDDGLLHVNRQTGRNAVAVQLMRVAAFRLQKDRVRLAPGEPDDLVLNGRAVARARGLDLTGVQRRAVEIGADDLVGALIGFGQVARQLRAWQFGGGETERNRRLIAMLRRKFIARNGAAIQTRRCPRLKAAQFNAVGLQGSGQPLGAGFAHATAGHLRRTNMNEAAQEGTGRQDHGPRAKLDAALAAHADGLAVRHQKFVCRGL